MRFILAPISSWNLCIMLTSSLLFALAQAWVTIAVMKIETLVQQVFLCQPSRLLRVHNVYYKRATSSLSHSIYSSSSSSSQLGPTRSYRLYPIIIPAVDSHYLFWSSSILILVSDHQSPPSSQCLLQESHFLPLTLLIITIIIIILISMVITPLFDNHSCC